MVLAGNYCAGWHFAIFLSIFLGISPASVTAAAAPSSTWASVATSSDYDTVTVACEAPKTASAMAYCYISTDKGVNWAQSKGSAKGWKKAVVTWGFVGSTANRCILAAEAGATGQIWKSTDKGATWTALTAAGSREWRGLAVSGEF